MLEDKQAGGSLQALGTHTGLASREQAGNRDVVQR